MAKQFGRDNFKADYALDWQELPLPQPDVEIMSPEEARAREQREIDKKVLKERTAEYEDKFQDIIFNLTKVAGLEAIWEFLNRRKEIVKAEGAGTGGGSAAAGDQTGGGDQSASS